MRLCFPITTDLFAVASFWVKVLRLHLQRSCALTISQFRVLSCLEQRSEGFPLHEIARMLKHSPSTTVFIVDSLEERGLICRCPNRYVRRSVNIRILPAGSSLLRRGFEISDAVWAEITAPLGKYLLGAIERTIELYGKSLQAQTMTAELLQADASLDVLISFEKRLAQLLKNSSLSITEFRVLFELESNPKKFTVNSLAHSLLLYASDVTVACNKLEQRGLVIKQKDHYDKRSIGISLSEKGCEKILAAAPMIDEAMLQMTTNCSQEEREMENKSARIIACYQRRSFVCDRTLAGISPL